MIFSFGTLRMRCFGPAFFLLVAGIFSLAPPAGAVPHLFGSKHEPRIETTAPGLPERLEKRSGIPASAWTGPLGTPATAEVLFLRVDFPPDTDPTTTGSGQWDDPAYARGGDPDYWVNKTAAGLKDYFVEVSYGRFTPRITVSERVYRLPRTMARYDDTTVGGYLAIVSDAVEAVGAAGGADRIGFAGFDAILIVHAGAGEETDSYLDSPGDFWSSFFPLVPLNAPIVTAWDGTPVWEGAIVPQTGSQDGFTVDPLGIYTHEFGHWLGLVDLYDTSSEPQAVGVGIWSLMGGHGSFAREEGGIFGSSPVHLDPWSKWLLGWFDAVEPVAGSDVGDVLLEPAAMSPRGFIVTASPGTEGLRYFLENRQATGFDRGLPGSGLLIWLIDQERIDATFQSNRVNTDPDHPGVRVVEADNLNNLLTTVFRSQDTGSVSDPFPGSLGRTEFTPRSSPSSSAAGAPAWVSLREIREEGDDVAFRLGFSPPAPTGFSVVEAGERVVLSWDPSPAEDLAVYRVYRDGVVITATTDTTYTEAATGLVYDVTAVDVNGNESAPGSTDTCLDNTPPDRPWNLVPAPGSRNIPPEILTLSATSFVDSDGWDAHEASRWQICRDALCEDVVLDSGVTAVDLVRITFESAGLDMGTTFFWRVAYSDGCAFSAWSEASAFTTETIAGSVADPPSKDSGKGGGGCFIATAAYGSYLAPDVKTLRGFRDRVLLKTGLGRAVVRIYYRLSPPAARLLSRSPALRAVVRAGLIPAVWCVKYPVGVVVLAVVAAVAVVFPRRISAADVRRET